MLINIQKGVNVCFNWATSLLRDFVLFCFVFVNSVVMNWQIKFFENCWILKYITQSLPPIMVSGHWGFAEECMIRKIQGALISLTTHWSKSLILICQIDVFTICSIRFKHFLYISHFFHKPFYYFCWQSLIFYFTYMVKDDGGFLESKNILRWLVN